MGMLAWVFCRRSRGEHPDGRRRLVSAYYGHHDVHEGGVIPARGFRLERLHVLLAADLIP